MTDEFKYVQAQSFTLAGAGATATDTSLILTLLTDPDGNLLAMTDFGTIGFGTIEPNSGTNEEQISFSGVTQNSNGTATLTGVKTVLFKAPYTQTSGLAKTHAGGTTFVITNSSGFYDKFVSKDNDETINGLITFAQNPIGINPGGTVDASTISKGITKISVAPASATEPIVVGDNDPRIPTTDEKAALAGTGTPSASNKYVTEDNAGLTNNVKLSGDQTVAGVKTFTSIPVLPASDPTTSNQAARKAYVDGMMAFTNTTEITGEIGGFNAPDTSNILISYERVGKYYFNFQAVVSSGNRCPMLGNDATSRARLCTKLGITEASHGSTYKLRVVSGPLGLLYTGSKWGPWDTIGDDMPVVSWIKST